MRSPRIVLWFSISALALTSACEDPPGDPILIIDLVGDNSRATDIGSLGFSPERVELFISDTPGGEPERVVVPDSGGKTLTLSFDSNNSALETVTLYSPRAGFLHQVRFIEDGVLIGGPAAPGGSAIAKVPSGSQTGIKIAPADGMAFELRRDASTRIEVPIDVGHQVNRPKKSEFHFKPALSARLVHGPSQPMILPDRLVVGFASGTTEARIAELVTEGGFAVIDSDKATRYYVLHVPSSLSLEAALEFFHGRPESSFVLPDNVIFYRQACPTAGALCPCDPNFQNPGPFTQVNAPTAWNVTTGSRAAVLAVIDNSFDLTSPEMINNYFINQGELLGVPAFDTNGDGTVTAAEVASFDTDGDGLISFVDLNAAAPAAIAGICPAGRNPTPPTCDPLDLVDGLGGNVGFEDGIDNDGNGRADDLVGWDFLNKDNLAHTPGVTGCQNAHGVGVAGVVAAIGAAPPVAPAVCASGLVSGMNWTARLIPIINGGGSTNTSTRAAGYLSIRYAAALGADAINASWGITYAQGADPGCGLSIPNLGNKFTDTVLPGLATEAAGLTLGNSVLVAAVDNCPQNDDAANLFDWPPALNSPNIIAVSGLQTNVAPPTLSATAAFGPVTVDIAAPSTNHTVLNFGGGTNNCGGTSYATPMITGAIGLVIANNVSPPTQGSAPTLINRVLCNATVVPALNGQLGGGGRILNVAASVTNANNCTP